MHSIRQESLHSSAVRAEKLHGEDTTSSSTGSYSRSCFLPLQSRRKDAQGSFSPLHRRESLKAIASPIGTLRRPSVAQSTFQILDEALYVSREEIKHEPCELSTWGAQVELWKKHSETMDSFYKCLEIVRSIDEDNDERSTAGDDIYNASLLLEVPLDPENLDNVFDLRD